MRLVGHSIGEKGVVVTRWMPDGPIPEGVHPELVSSPAEDERQRKMREGSW